MVGTFRRVLLAAALSAAGVAWAALPSERLIAHKGGKEVAAPNALAAFKGAFAAGLAAECDVRLAKDGTLYLSHDALKDWRGAAKLGDLLAAMPTGAVLELDLKCGAEAMDAIVKEIARTRADEKGRIVFSTGDRKAAARIAADLPRCTAWMSYAKTGTAAEIAKRVSDFGARGISLKWNDKACTKEFFRELAASNVEVNVWTVDDAATARRAINRGARWVTTNVPLALADIGTDLEEDMKANRKPIRTAIYVDEGARNTGVYRWLELATCSKQLDAYPVDAAMIRAGILDKTDVLVMPGGGAAKQSATLGTNGCERIRAFVKRGGGYIGTCAGCFLALESSPTHPGMLHLMPYRSEGPKGLAGLNIRFNSRAKALAGIPRGVRELRFADGPVMVPSLPVKGAEFEILATYDSDVNPCGEPPRQSFAGQAAVVAGTYGKGRVFASAVHPEYSLVGHRVVRGAFKFVTGRNVTWTLPQRKRGQLPVAFVTLKSFGVETARWLQEQFRAQEFDLQPFNRESFGNYVQDHVEAVIAPGGTDMPFGGLPVFTDPAAAVAPLRELAARPSEATGRLAVPPLPDGRKPIRVAAFADKGGADYYITGRLVRSPGYEVTPVSGADIAAGALKDFDMLVQPGGGCRAQCLALGEKGCEELVKFIRGGGKYYGVCAGAFMSSQVIHPEFLRLGFVPYKDEDEPVYRGGCHARMRVTEAGRAVFRDPSETRSVFYNGGPVFVPGDPLPDTDVKVLMTYDCENISTKHPDPVMSMRGKGAFLGGRVGKGKVFISGPHPEGDCYVDDIVDDGVAFLTGVLPEPVRYARRHGATVVRFRSASDRDANAFYLHRLLPDGRFDVRTGGSGFSLQHADVCVIARPDKEDSLGGDLRAFAENGGRVFVLADTDAKRKAIADLGWVTAFASYDALFEALAR